MSLPRNYLPFFLETGSLIGLELTNRWAGWPESPRDLPASNPTRAGITGACHYAWLLKYGSWIKLRVLMLER